MDYEKVSKSNEKVTHKFNCQFCDYHTSHNSNWKKHIQTKKHNDYAMTTQDYSKVSESNDNCSFYCECGKNYVNRQNLYRHKKKCNYEQKQEHNYDKNIVVSNRTKLEQELMEENRALVNQLIKVNDKLLENGINNQTINNNQVNTNNFNNSFNINLFLNEQCKDAMTIQDYAQRLMLSMEDLLKANKNRSEGITEIIFKNLSPMDITERPVHCTGKDKWFIKDKNDGWSEDKNKNRLISETQFGIQRKVQKVFDDEYPDWINNEQLEEKYAQTIGTAMGDLSARDVKKVRDAAKSICKIDSNNNSNV